MQRRRQAKLSALCLQAACRLASSALPPFQCHKKSKKDDHDNWNEYPKDFGVFGLYHYWPAVFVVWRCFPFIRSKQFIGFGPSSSHALLYTEDSLRMMFSRSSSGFFCQALKPSIAATMATTSSDANSISTHRGMPMYLCARSSLILIAVRLLSIKSSTAASAVHRCWASWQFVLECLRQLK